MVLINTIAPFPHNSQFLEFLLIELFVDSLLLQDL
jgi:hypothetical protein